MSIICRYSLFKIKSFLEVVDIYNIFIIFFKSKLNRWDPFLDVADIGSSYSHTDDLHDGDGDAENHVEGLEDWFDLGEVEIVQDGETAEPVDGVVLVPAKVGTLHKVLYLNQMETFWPSKV